MSRFWSKFVHDLQPYIPGEQPRLPGPRIGDYLRITIGTEEEIGTLLGRLRTILAETGDRTS